MDSGSNSGSTSSLGRALSGSKKNGKVERSPSGSRMLSFLGRGAETFGGLRRKRSSRSEKRISAELEISGPVELEASTPALPRTLSYSSPPPERAAKRLSSNSDVLQPGSPPAQEFVIDPNGDTILQFENPHAIIQFRVQSSALTNAGGVFARVVADISRQNRQSMPDTLRGYLPKTPARYSESKRANVVVMPKEEHNVLSALETLLCAAHFRNDRLPTEVKFRELVEIASVCDRYNCFNPVMQIAHLSWVPQWKDKVGESGFEDWLYISWIFGLKDVFQQTSRQTVLELKSESDMRDKLLPPIVREHIRRHRAATLSRILRECSNLLFTYMHRPPMPPRHNSDTRDNVFRKHKALCPLRQEQCDATNIGWLILTFQEFAISNAVLDYSTNPHYKEGAWFSHPIGTLLQYLRNVPSPPRVHEGDTCDYAPSFRQKMEDIFKSTSGLDIAEVNQNLPLAPSTNPTSPVSDTSIGVAESYANSHPKSPIRTDKSYFGLSPRFPPTPPLAFNAGGPEAAAAALEGRRRWNSAPGIYAFEPDELNERNLASLTEETHSIISSVVSIRGDRCDSPSPSVVTRTTVDGSVVTATADSMRRIALQNARDDIDEFEDIVRPNQKEVISPAQKEAFIAMRMNNRTPTGPERPHSWEELPDMI